MGKSKNGHGHYFGGKNSFCDDKIEQPNGTTDEIWEKHIESQNQDPYSPSRKTPEGRSKNW